MKFKIHCDYKDHAPESTGWWEKYDNPEIENFEQAKAWGKDIVDFFNSTLRPQKKERIFIEVEIIGESDIQFEHDWEKTNLVTIISSVGMYDTYKCSVCGITGKRFGLGSKVIRDGKYSKEKYRNCNRRKDDD